LAVEWVGPDYTKFLVGYSSGLLCFYKAENTSQKPSKMINLNTHCIKSM
jgi:hypothetical protein